MKQDRKDRVLRALIRQNERLKVEKAAETESTAQPTQIDVTNGSTESRNAEKDNADDK